MTTATTPVTNPNVTRSRLVLEIASEMAGGAAADAVPDYVLPKVVLQHSRGGKPVTFSGVSSAEGIFAVAAREVDLAMINPAAVLAVARRGQDEARLAPRHPEPVGERAVAVPAHLGVQVPQLVRVSRGLRPVEQLERDLRLARHGPIFPSRDRISANSGRSTTAK